MKVMAKTPDSQPSKEEMALFQDLLSENRFCFEKLVYIIFPFGEKGHELEHEAPYEWQIEKWRKLSLHLQNPATRFQTYKMIISSGNGAAKTAFGCMTLIMLLYTQRLQARITANTDPQLKTVVWPEMDVWFRHARYIDYFFDKHGTSIKAKNPDLASKWRIDTVTWSEEAPAAISGLHNKGGAVCYMFEEAPGIPAVIWDYASGAFTETGTIKLWMAFGNSDDPESKFEQNMESVGWDALRIDTRTLKHIDPKQIADWLEECGGDENHDDFRVRVRGLPRKAAKDSTISRENVDRALDRRMDFDMDKVEMFPTILMCDPAWTGGDETCIWMRRGYYAKLLEKYKLDKARGQDHMFTYNMMCKWERELGVDAVFIDQGEGTALFTLANNAGKFWELVSFGSAANDAPDFRDSQYSNIRAQMYWESNQWLAQGAVLDSEKEEWIEDIRAQLCWTKGTRHKVHGKKLAEPKLDVKKRIGRSPDVADGFVLGFARPVFEKVGNIDGPLGSEALMMPPEGDPYDDLEVSYKTLYD